MEGRKKDDQKIERKYYQYFTPKQKKELTCLYVVQFIFFGINGHCFKKMNI